MRPSVRLLRERTSQRHHDTRGMLRRVVVGATDAVSVAWQLLGYFFGTDEADREKWADVESFQGIGFASRPRAGAKAEAVVAHIGAEHGHPIVIAARDQSIAPTLQEDETEVFNSTVRVYLTKQRTVVIDDGNGAVPLATKADVDAINAFLQKQFDTAAGHTHAGAGLPASGSGAGVGAGFSVPTATGTTVLKGK